MGRRITKQQVIVYQVDNAHLAAARLAQLVQVHSPQVFAGY